MQSNKQPIKIIYNPFPQQRVPAFQTVAIQRPTGPVGVVFRTDDSGTVAFSRIAKESPLNSTPIGVGHACLAINGQAVTTAKHAAEIIRDSQSPMITFTYAEPCSPHYKMVVAPVSKTLAGISLTSSRDEALVAVSRVFKGHFAATSIKVGDIVLAVNGVPVTDKSDALRLMKASEGLVVLYVLDMESVRSKIVEEITSSAGWAGTQLQRTGDKTFKLKVPKGNAQRTFDVELDLNSMKIVDHEAHTRLAAEPLVGKISTFQTLRVYYTVSYKTLGRPFLEKMNFILERQLSALEEIVGNQAWAHDMSDAMPHAVPLAQVSSLTPLAACHVPGGLGVADEEPKSRPMNQVVSLF